MSESLGSKCTNCKCDFKCKRVKEKPVGHLYEFFSISIIKLSGGTKCNDALYFTIISDTKSSVFRRGFTPDVPGGIHTEVESIGRSNGCFSMPRHEGGIKRAHVSDCGEHIRASLSLNFSLMAALGGGKVFLPSLA